MADMEPQEQAVRAWALSEEHIVDMPMNCVYRERTNWTDSRAWWC